ncbi:uncharacterized protein [Dysidea avara]|uniref:uncharacterized protein isoform X2 n=1 Tax=Dysidea avara TaxID=196820 RepID=UPI003328B985
MYTIPGKLTALERSDGRCLRLAALRRRSDYFVERWYRQTESREEYIKDGLDLTVNFNAMQENYTCDILPLSLGCDRGSKGYVSLIKGSAPVLSLLNHTDTGSITVTEGSHAIVYFKVDTNGYLTKPLLLSLKESDITSRWFITYYAATSTGIGEMIYNTANLFHFYVRLETITQYSHQYDDGTYSVQAENECGMQTLDVILKGSCDDSIPLQFVEKPPLHMYAVAGQNVTMHFKYNGVNIHNIWMVNHTKRLYNTTIHHTSNHFKLYCDEVYNFKLIKVQYGGYFTIYSSRGAHDPLGLNTTIHLKVYKVPHLIGTYTETTSNTALLQWSYTASCNHSHLIELTWQQNGHYNFQDGRFSQYIHCLDDNTILVHELKIKDITSSDSGNYTSHLKYNYLIVHTVAMSTGSILLNVSGTRSPHTLSGTEMMLISSLGAVVTAVILFAVLLIGFVIRRRRKPQKPYPNERTHLLPRSMTSATTFTTMETSLASSIITASPPSSLTSLDPVKISSSLTHSLNESSPINQWLQKSKHKIAKLLAEKDKLAMAEGFRNKGLLNTDQLNQFALEEDPRQCYLDVIDAILNDPTKIEAFYCYMVEMDEHLQEHIAPKVLLLYSLTGEQSFRHVLLPFTNLLRHRGINATSDFYEVDIGNHQTWIQEHIAECIENEGFVLVDISNFLDSDFHASKIELQMRHGQYSFDLAQFNSSTHFIPICLNKPVPSNRFQRKVYEINISYYMTEFYRRYQACSNDSSEAEMIISVLNDALESLQPLIELINYISTVTTRQQHALRKQ